jgi:phenylpyruvate tautomerase PptA (4-oxalocrotonate tautomerase family)
VVEAELEAVAVAFQEFEEAQAIVVVVEDGFASVYSVGESRVSNQHRSADNK